MGGRRVFERREVDDTAAGAHIGRNFSIALLLDVELLSELEVKVGAQLLELLELGLRARSLRTGASRARYSTHLAEAVGGGATYSASTSARDGMPRPLLALASAPARRKISRSECWLGRRPRFAMPPCPGLAAAQPRAAAAA